MRDIEARISRFVRDPAITAVPAEVLSRGLDLLPVLRELLCTDLPIEAAERVEDILKAVLKAAFCSPLPGQAARDIAIFQKNYGFVLKYKSYAIKAATPLGYSIFLQNPGEGFSFQQHVTHKTEVFHILRTSPGAYVFVCEFGDWQRHYDPGLFRQWLTGEPHEFFDRHKFSPSPGDVFVIASLGVVHTVVGCVLEEYATVSTDMVDRLHDQNAGKRIPAHFTREYAERELVNLALPRQNRLIDIREGRISPIEPVSMPGGRRRVLEDSFVRASLAEIAPRAQTDFQRDPRRATILRVSSGAGVLFAGDEGELPSPGRMALPAAAGDVFLIPPGTLYGIRNEGSEMLEYAEHQIEPAAAFV